MIVGHISGKELEEDFARFARTLRDMNLIAAAGLVRLSTLNSGPDNYRRKLIPFSRSRFLQDL